MIIPSRRLALPAAIAVVAAIAGAVAALHYHRLGLTLSHYDARGHLIVARRIADSLTPGWQQIGAVWLPLPHLLNFLPSQIDLFYRTGAAAVAISVIAFTVATGALAWIVREITGSAAAAIAASAVFALNPNVLYLQATPMTETLFLALMLTAIALLIEWCRPGPLDPANQHARGGSERTRPTSQMVGWAFVLACLTRYEAWLVTGCALVVSLWVLYRKGDRLLTACGRVRAIAVYPCLAAVSFVIFSRVVTGEWMADSFFVPENKALGRPLGALAEIGWGARALNGPFQMSLATVGLCALFVTAIRNRRRAGLLVTFALLASAALPWAAFVRGHPFRIRYMVPLIPMAAIGVGAVVALHKRAVLVTALVVGLALAYESRPPLDLSAPVVLEAQWDRPNAPLRQRVTDCLRLNYGGETIMASMGSLGHYMQETARDGFDVRDFLHEGNGDIWLAALDGPRRYAGWVLIEEKAEGGDMLAKIARANAAFLDGYDRVCEGGGLASYRRRDPPQRP